MNYNQYAYYPDLISIYCMKTLKYHVVLCKILTILVDQTKEIKLEKSFSHVMLSSLQEYSGKLANSRTFPKWPLLPSHCPPFSATALPPLI